jgi:hypothetical protein
MQCCQEHIQLYSIRISISISISIRIAKFPFACKKNKK